MHFPAQPPKFDLDRWVDLIKKTRAAPIPDDAYLHWDELRRRKALNGLTQEDVWVLLKGIRRGTLRELPLADKLGRPLTFNEPDEVREQLRQADMRAAGQIALDRPVVSEDDGRRYLMRSIVEEPFYSSALEGAATTRAIAKAMIFEGREPTSVDERMVLNNFRALQLAKSEARADLTPQLILDIHRVATRGTLDDPAMAGALRTDDHTVTVVDADGEVLHIPPTAAELPGRLDRLCAFANGEGGDGRFIHPLVRATLLHFMLAYDHPFVDGNGRTARALFYWASLRHGYWLMEYISISRGLKQAPAKYGLAFLHTETDDFDATYFLKHQMANLIAALTDLENHVRRKQREQRALEEALDEYKRLLNHRQVALIQRALRQGDFEITIETHRRLEGVSYLTARQDLETMAEARLLEKRKDGRQSIYRSRSDRMERLLNAPPD